MSSSTITHFNILFATISKIVIVLIDFLCDLSFDPLGIPMFGP